MTHNLPSQNRRAIRCLRYEVKNLVSFPEAPIDSKQYARKDGAWEAVQEPTPYLMSSTEIIADNVATYIDVVGNNLQVITTLTVENATVSSFYLTKSNTIRIELNVSSVGLKDLTINGVVHANFINVQLLGGWTHLGTDTSYAADFGYDNTHSTESLNSGDKFTQTADGLSAPGGWRNPFNWQAKLNDFELSVNGSIEVLCEVINFSGGASCFFGLIDKALPIVIHNQNGVTTDHCYLRVNSVTGIKQYTERTSSVDKNILLDAPFPTSKKMIISMSLKGFTIYNVDESNNKTSLLSTNLFEVPNIMPSSTYVPIFYKGSQYANLIINAIKVIS